jgi:hypothetical protein
MTDGTVFRCTTIGESLLAWFADGGHARSHAEVLQALGRRARVKDLP